MTLGVRVALRRRVELSIDGETVTALEGDTILDVLLARGVETPTLCYVETLAPVNVCRVCVIELEGSRPLVPSCSRQVEAGMKVLTDSERVRTSRRMVLQLLASSVDLSLAGEDVPLAGWRATALAPSATGPRHHPSQPGNVTTPTPGGTSWATVGRLPRSPNHRSTTTPCI